MLALTARSRCAPGRTGRCLLRTRPLVLSGWALAVEENEAADSGDVCGLCLRAQVPRAHDGADAIEQARRRSSCRPGWVRRGRAARETIHPLRWATPILIGSPGGRRGYKGKRGFHARPCSQRRARGRRGTSGCSPRPRAGPARRRGALHRCRALGDPASLSGVRNLGEILEQASFVAAGNARHKRGRPKTSGSRPSRPEPGGGAVRGTGSLLTGALVIAEPGTSSIAIPLP